ncbi:DNA adenine methylase [Leeuwenhoekiella parthenopeia]|uniref:DNA adenine methylase n=1 Tax=Leeuwenhoekiella parthenopeia TaxID=2890320 RepID=UPI0033133D38
MDCRFNKQELIDRISKIANYKKHIRLYKKDAVKLIDKIQLEAENDNIVFYFDPPYYLKASTLYMNHYEYKNHKTVSDKIKSIQNIKWIVSYDNVPEIQQLYFDCQKKEFSFKHTAYKIREGKEIMFFSKNIEQPKIDDWDPLRFKLNKDKSTSNIIYK